MAMALRLEGIPHSYWEATWIYTLLGIPIKALIIALFGLHRQAWSRVGVRDLVRLGLAVALAGLSFSEWRGR